MTPADLPSTVLPSGEPAPTVTTTHQIGPMLRQRRKELNLTLAQVAEQVGIATGFLSEIERDQASPSVATLIRLCDALGVPVGSLFTSNQPLLVRAGAREKMRYGGQMITYELLTSRTAHQMASIMSQLLPGGMSGPEQHSLNAEEEFVLVLNGELIMEIGAQQFHLFEGDALTFDPRQKHRYLNPSKSQVCRTLCVITPQPR
ncbi:MAG: helix-turn-helix domain-containing protein [Tabrizicola sp.]|nr:helix-turn-helix domain-containing protein [Tabrizicola sp.]